MLRIGIVVGEPSGDELGAGLVEALKQQHPNVEVEGIVGPRVMAAGGRAIFPMSKLTVMGISEVLLEYPELASIRNRLKHHFLDKTPDVFIGIDAPDFNLKLEEELRLAGIRTVHYVSPSVWAWRHNRVKQVSRSADLLLTLFPFEASFYSNVELDIECVGHPLADSIPVTMDSAITRKELGVPMDKKVVAVMPGSRKNELSRLSTPFIETAATCYERDKDLIFISSLLDDESRQFLEKQIKEIAPQVPFKVFCNRSRDVLQASDAALLASGTITLETMLLKKPMVVAYKMSPFTYYALRLLISTRWASLPNILAQDTLVPEFFQSDVTASKLAPALHYCLYDMEYRNYLIDRFSAMHSAMRLGSSSRAAKSILRLCGY